MESKTDFSNAGLRPVPNSALNLQVHEMISKLEVQRQHSESLRNAFTNPPRIIPKILLVFMQLYVGL